METNCVQQVKPLASRFSGVLLDGCGELGSGKVLEQLIEQACDLYDWIALLWAAFGEAPSKELLANVNYRRALILISDCKNLFWTRVLYYAKPGNEERNATRVPEQVRVIRRKNLWR